MLLVLPLPERLSTMDAARLARAVSLAVEESCGFIVEPKLITFPRAVCEDHADA